MIAHFEAVLQPVIAAEISPGGMIAANETIEQLEPCVEKVDVFLEDMVGLGYEKSMVADFLGISAIDDFYVVATKLETFFQDAPVMRGWVALDDKGQCMPPWTLKGAIAFQHTSTGMIFTNAQRCEKLKHSALAYDQALALALALADEMNAHNICNRQDWKIPRMEELNLVDLDGLAHSGTVNVPRKFWITHANGPGRLSAYSRKDNSRIMTGVSDRFAAVFISN